MKINRRDDDSWNISWEFLSGSSNLFKNLNLKNFEVTKLKTDFIYKIKKTPSVSIAITKIIGRNDTPKKKLPITTATKTVPIMS